MRGKEAVVVVEVMVREGPSYMDEDKKCKIYEKREKRAKTEDENLRVKTETISDSKYMKVTLLY